MGEGDRLRDLEERVQRAVATAQVSEDGGKIMNPCLPVMKKIRNTKGAALCIAFLLGVHCYYIVP